MTVRMLSLVAASTFAAPTPTVSIAPANSPDKYFLTFIVNFPVSFNGDDHALIMFEIVLAVVLHFDDHMDRVALSSVVRNGE